MVTVGTGMNARQVAVDNTFGIGGNRESHTDLLNALPFRPATAGRYYVSIQGQWGGIAPNRVYTLSVQSDDYGDTRLSTTAVVAVGGSIRTYIMRTETNASSTSTGDFDTIKVALQANTRYRIVWDVACLHEGIIRYIIDATSIPWVPRQTISRETDGWCTDLTYEFTPPLGGDYFIIASARGSDFPERVPLPVPGRLGHPHGRAHLLVAEPPCARRAARPAGERKVGATPTADTSSIPTGHDTSNPVGLLAATRTAPAIRPRVETPPSHRQTRSEQRTPAAFRPGLARHRSCLGLWRLGCAG